jgi:hypothetical protein
LEEANVFTPTRHLLLTIKRTWQLDRIHGLPAVAVPAFFPSASKNDECWWGIRDLNAVYIWDSMEDQDRRSSLEAIRDTENRVIWKTKNDIWTHTLKMEGFHQLLGLYILRSSLVLMMSFLDSLLRSEDVAFNGGTLTTPTSPRADSCWSRSLSTLPGVSRRKIPITVHPTCFHG